MDITNINREALDRYFNAITQLGYMNYDNVNSLILLSFIEELLTSELQYFLTEKDYRTIYNVLYCLFGSSCLIDLPFDDTGDSLMHGNKNEFVPRITEDTILRSTETLEVRIEA